MLAKIYQPSKTAVQSGRARLGQWVLEFETQAARRIDPLMGWTSTDDHLAGQVRLTFDSREEAVRYAESRNIPYQLLQPRVSRPVAKAYADNFAYRRRTPWTH
jgi:hypothetical protein